MHPSSQYLLLIFFLTYCTSCVTAQKKQLYKDSNLPVSERVEDLLEKMTPEEKFWQLFMIPGDLSDGKEKYSSGIFGFQVATKGKSGNEAEQLLDYSGGSSALETVKTINSIQKYFIEESRLGIPIIPFDEALHGLVRPGATAFPQAIGLAATWDTSLVRKVATAIALEVRSRGIRQILSPVVNIAADVRWGRTEETYGEDPFLTSSMGVAFMKAFEDLGVITTPKHFVANVGRGGRDSYPIHYNERLLEEVYFPAFKAAFQEAGARSLMTAYNSVDGRQATASEYLLRQKVKEDWGLDGFIISDAGATGGANVLHFTAKDYAESTAQAIENGLDVIFQTSYDHYPLFKEAFDKGLISQKAIDDAVRRVLKAKFDLGLFENPYTDKAFTAKWNGHQQHLELARETAEKSIVLLRNEESILPINKDISSIAVIGTDAIEARLGGYSGPGRNPISILEGLNSVVSAKTKINFVPGPGRTKLSYTVIHDSLLFHEINGSKKSGLQAHYYDNPHLSGSPALTRNDGRIDFGWTLFSPDPEKLPYDWYSARWQGKLTAPLGGTYHIGLHGDDGYKLFINGELLVDNWKKEGFGTVVKPFTFTKGQVYNITVEFYETVGNARISLVWDMGLNDSWKNEIGKAVEIAKESEVAIVVVGIEEGEFRDRAMLSLPGHQEELINRVVETGTPTIVVLVGGSAITMQNWIHKVPAILDVWYPGEQGGYAVADVLVGNTNPAGRLPITFPVHEAQLPLSYLHKPTGRGDDYINLTGKPLFPFGFGLSYTSFEYSDLKISSDTIQVGESLEIKMKIANTGQRDGDEVVQLYLKDIYASVARPLYELKGFQRIHLNRGETVEVSFTLHPESMQMLDEGMQTVIEPGTFRIMAGASSRDIRLRGEFEVIGQ